MFSLVGSFVLDLFKIKITKRLRLVKGLYIANGLSLVRQREQGSEFKELM